MEGGGKWREEERDVRTGAERRGGEALGRHDNEEN